MTSKTLYLYPFPDSQHRAATSPPQRNRDHWHHSGYARQQKHRRRHNILARMMPQIALDLPVNYFPFSSS